MTSPLCYGRLVTAPRAALGFWALCEAWFRRGFLLDTFDG